ncbi:MAG: ABC transporter permease, partial [Fermentimonas sp.]|nr:ABC transporter permease [Fermentimonas sp.]
MKKINLTAAKQRIKRKLKVKEETRNFYNGVFIDLGELVLFTGKVTRQMFTPPFEFREFLKHGFLLGNKSLALVSVTGFIMGLVLTMQMNPVLTDFGAQTLLP